MTDLGLIETEAALRDVIRAQLPLAAAPIPLRMAFHDAASYDPATGTGGAQGLLRFARAREHDENRSFKQAIEAIGAARDQHPELGWADVIAVAGAVAVELCEGPVITVGLGRRDATEALDYPLPTEDIDGDDLRREFARRGFSDEDLVALSGAHTLGGRVGGPAFTADPRRFSNSYFRCLLEGDREAGLTLLRSDRALVAHPVLRAHVERFAADQDAFFSAFADAYVRLTWLGQARPTATNARSGKAFGRFGPPGDGDDASR
jgi:L-ascorbate peroxidase